MHKVGNCCHGYSGYKKSLDCLLCGELIAAGLAGAAGFEGADFALDGPTAFTVLALALATFAAPFFLACWAASFPLATYSNLPTRLYVPRRTLRDRPV